MCWQVSTLQNSSKLQNTKLIILKDINFALLFDLMRYCLNIALAFLRQGLVKLPAKSKKTKWF